MAGRIRNEIEKAICPVNRFFAIFDVEESVAADDFLRFRERPVGDRGLAALARDDHLEHLGHASAGLDEYAFGSPVFDELINFRKGLWARRSHLTFPADVVRSRAVPA